MTSLNLLLLFFAAIAIASACSVVQKIAPNSSWLRRSFATIAVASSLLPSLPAPSFAVSGGGLDFATKNIRGEVFDKQALTSKDFTQCDATQASFKGTNLKGSRFYRAKLAEADFTNADLSSASLEDSDLTKANLKNAVLAGAYLSNSILDVGDITNVDFTDASFTSEKLRKQLCLRSDATGANTITNVDTRDSLICE